MADRSSLDVLSSPTVHFAGADDPAGNRLTLIGDTLPVAVVAAAGAAQAIDLTAANVWDLKLTAAACVLAIAPIAGAHGLLLHLVLRQDATGGRTVTWPASVKWPAATAPVLSAGANKVDRVSLLSVDGGTTWLGGPPVLDIR